MSEMNITKNNFEQEVLHSDKPVLIDFWAPWCGPCRMLSPVISEIAEEYGDKIKVCKVNVDDEGELAASFNVMSIPTLVVVKDGKVAIRGWRETADVGLWKFAGELTALGVKTIICTDISRDGAMRGANRELYRELTGAFSIDVVASGGVSGLEDIRALKRAGAAGAIIGKAYYTGALKLDEAKEAAE